MAASAHTAHFVTSDSQTILARACVQTDVGQVEASYLPVLAQKRCHRWPLWSYCDPSYCVYTPMTIPSCPRGRARPTCPVVAYQWGTLLQAVYGQTGVPTT